MTYYEALFHCDKLNLSLHSPSSNEKGHASAERILPHHIDPAKPGDNGWDVLVTMD